MADKLKLPLADIVDAAPACDVNYAAEIALPLQTAAGVGQSPDRTVECRSTKTARPPHRRPRGRPRKTARFAEAIPKSHNMFVPYSVQHVFTLIWAMNIFRI